MSTCNILDLNVHCLESIMAYLPLADKISLALGARKFENCLVRFLRKDKFLIKELLKRFTVEQSENIFKKFGFEIRRVCLDETVRNETFYHSLLAKYCTKLKEIHCSCAGSLTPVVCKQLIANSDSLQTLSLCGSYYDARISFDVVFEDISKLTHLTSLSLSCTNVTGEHLSQLTKLKNLSLRSCWDLEPQYFMEICKSTKLLTINICGYENLSNEAIETLVETQTELQKIALRFDCKATNIGLIAQLPKLKEIHYISFTIEDMEVYLTALSVHKNKSLESIFVADIHLRDSYSRYSPTCDGDLDEIRAKILKLRKLKQLRFPVSYFANRDFLEALPNACPDLEMLEMGGSYMATVDILQAISRLKSLTHLSVGVVYPRYTKFHHDLVEVVKERKTVPLKFYSYYDKESQPFFESMEYIHNKKYVQVLFKKIGDADYSIFNDTLKTSILDFKESAANKTLREDSDLLTLPDKILRKITTLLHTEDKVKLLLIHDRFHSAVTDSLKDQKINLRELSKFLTFAETEQILDICSKYLDKIYFIYKDGVKPVEYLEVVNSYKDGFVEVDVDSEPENFMEMANLLFGSE